MPAAAAPQLEVPAESEEIVNPYAGAINPYGYGYNGYPGYGYGAYPYGAYGGLGGYGGLVGYGGLGGYGGLAGYGGKEIKMNSKGSYF